MSQNKDYSKEESKRKKIGENTKRSRNWYMKRPERGTNNADDCMGCERMDEYPRYMETIHNNHGYDITSRLKWCNCRR